MKPFRLHEPVTPQEAAALLAQESGAAALYAGGTELLLAMKAGLLAYDDREVDGGVDAERRAVRPRRDARRRRAGRLDDIRAPELELPHEVLAMALNTPTDRALVNVIAAYEREIMGARLSANDLTRIAESIKRMMLDEIHSAKSAR